MIKTTDMETTDINGQTDDEPPRPETTDAQFEADFEFSLSFLEARIAEALAEKADKESIPDWLRG